MTKQGSQGMVAIISVEQAQSLIREEQVSTADISLVCDAVVNSDVIVGSSTDYHNLAVEMTRKGCYLHGFNIVTKGLKLYPYNIDLLADAVYYGSCAGKFEECEQYAVKLRSRPYALWNWRAYTFMIDYYMDKADWTMSETDILQSMSTALELAMKAQKILATEERGYLAEHQVHEALERWNREAAVRDPDNSMNYLDIAETEHSLSIGALKKAIDNEQIVAVQCSLRYADIKFEAREYEETIRVCERAFCYAESQPSAKMGYFLYLAAMSMDALIHENRMYEDRDRVTECYRMYQAADRTLDSNRSAYRNNIKLRVNNLETRSGIPAGFHIQDNENSANMLRKLLGSLDQENDE